MNAIILDLTGETMMSSFHGKFVWYELMTTDTTAAAAFYRGVMGWNARDAGMPGMSYTILSAGEANVAGLMALPDTACAAGERPGWMAHVAVDDVDASAAQAKQLGGSLHHPPTDIPGVGRFAIIADPDGAILALFKPGGMAPGAPVPQGTPGHGGWHELYALNREGAFAFYSKLFGWTKGDSLDMGPMGVYQIFNRGSDMTGGMMTKPEAAPAPGWRYYFNVAGINPAETRVKSGGGQVLNGPHEVPGGSWILQCRDPQGAMFALVGPRG
jgi:uncharacterized protein